MIIYFFFVDYLKNFQDEKTPRQLTINHITLRTQQTKTIKERMSFSISKEDNDIIDFFKSKNQSKKSIKSFFYIFIRVF